MYYLDFVLLFFFTFLVNGFEFFFLIDAPKDNFTTLIIAIPKLVRKSVEIFCFILKINNCSSPRH